MARYGGSAAKAREHKALSLAPSDTNFFVHLTPDVLIREIADLRCRVEHAGSRRQIAQALLAKAHIDKAVGLLRTIEPAPSTHELDIHGSTKPQARRPMLRAGREYLARAVGT
jgi:hypothetical protein